MSLILRDMNAVRDAARGVLETTYRAFSGRVEPVGCPDAALRTLTELAMLRAQNAAGHLGVPNGSAAPFLTYEELLQKGFDLNKDDPNPFPMGSMAHGLFVAARNMDAIKPRERRRSETAVERKRILSVRKTAGGTTKLQAGSARKLIMQFVEAQTAAVVSLTDIEAALGIPVRGHVQKLIETNHLENVE